MRALMRGRLMGLERNRALKQGGAIIVTVVAILLGATAHAQYRCIQPGAAVSYQQTPCASDADSNRIQLSPSAISPPGGSENRTDWAAVIKSRPQADSGPPSAGSNPRNCPTPQQIKSMEYDASKLSNRHNSGMQRELARARACR